MVMENIEFVSIISLVIMPTGGLENPRQIFGDPPQKIKKHDFLKNQKKMFLVFY